MPVMALGLNSLVSRELMQRAEDTVSILGSAIGLRLSAGLLVAAVAVLAAHQLLTKPVGFIFTSSDCEYRSRFLRHRLLAAGTLSQSLWSYRSSCGVGVGQRCSTNFHVFRFWHRYLCLSDLRRVVAISLVLFSGLSPIWGSLARLTPTRPEASHLLRHVVGCGLPLLPPYSCLR